MLHAWKNRSLRRSRKNLWIWRTGTSGADPPDQALFEKILARERHRRVGFLQPFQGLNFDPIAAATSWSVLWQEFAGFPLAVRQLQAFLDDRIPRPETAGVATTCGLRSGGAQRTWPGRLRFEVCLFFWRKARSNWKGSGMRKEFPGRRRIATARPRTPCAPKNIFRKKLGGGLPAVRGLGTFLLGTAVLATGHDFPARHGWWALISADSSADHSRLPAPPRAARFRYCDAGAGAPDEGELPGQRADSGGYIQSIREFKRWSGPDYLRFTRRECTSAVDGGIRPFTSLGRNVIVRTRILKTRIRLVTAALSRKSFSP